MFQKCILNVICDVFVQDVFIVDTKAALFVWIGKGTSTGEKKNAMQYAHVSSLASLSLALSLFLSVQCVCVFVGLWDGGGGFVGVVTWGNTGKMV